MSGKAHELKTDPEMLVALLTGAKTAEFRRNDRDYQVGDELHLRGWHAGKYTRVEARFAVTHIVRGPAFGIPEGFAMLSVRPA